MAAVVGLLCARVARRRSQDCGPTQPQRAMYVASHASCVPKYVYILAIFKHLQAPSYDDMNEPT
jgi:hypothetical protein